MVWNDSLDAESGDLVEVEINIDEAILIGSDESLDHSEIRKVHQIYCRLTVIMVQDII